MKVYDLDFPTYFGKLDSWPNLFQQKKEQPGGSIVCGYFVVVEEWVLCTRIGYWEGDNSIRSFYRQHYSYDVLLNLY